jgi:hypothetical protein
MSVARLDVKGLVIRQIWPGHLERKRCPLVILAHAASGPGLSLTGHDPLSLDRRRHISYSISDVLSPDCGG